MKDYMAALRARRGSGKGKRLIGGKRLNNRIRARVEALRNYTRE